jgi:catechol 2,3-dioxygenase-like lactoylglutathione lyase family enzyme
MTTTEHDLLAAESESGPKEGPKEGLPRVQLGLNVGSIDEAVEFYSKLFGAEPHKRREGYANFALTNPPLKLVLFEDGKAPGTLNHLGVEVAEISDVNEARTRIEAAGLNATHDENGVCCHAEQAKVWIDAPDGVGWEYYTITDDNPVISTLEYSGSACCSS